MMLGIKEIVAASIDSDHYHEHVVGMKTNDKMRDMADCWAYFRLLHGDERPMWTQEMLRRYLSELVHEYRQVTLDMIRHAYDDEQSLTVG